MSVYRFAKFDKCAQWRRERGTDAIRSSPSVFHLVELQLPGRQQQRPGRPGVKLSATVRSFVCLNTAGKLSTVPDQVWHEM